MFVFSTNCTSLCYPSVDCLAICSTLILINLLIINTVKTQSITRYYLMKYLILQTILFESYQVIPKTLKMVGLPTAFLSDARHSRMDKGS